MALGHEEALKRAKAVIAAHRIQGDKYELGGLAHGMVDALVYESEGFDPDAAQKLDLVAEIAQESAFRNKPWSEPREDFTLTINARTLANDVLRAGIHAGVVVPADERMLRALAHHGSAGHDDTAQTLRAASNRDEEG